MSHLTRCLQPASAHVYHLILILKLYLLILVEILWVAIVELMIWLILTILMEGRPRPRVLPLKTSNSSQDPCVLIPFLLPTFRLILELVLVLICIHLQKLLLVQILKHVDGFFVEVTIYAPLLVVKLSL